MSALRQGKVRTDLQRTCPRCGQASHFAKPQTSVALIECVAGDCDQVFVYDEYARTELGQSVEDYTAIESVSFVNAAKHRAIEIVQIALSVTIPLTILTILVLDFSWAWLACAVSVVILALSLPLTLVKMFDMRASERASARSRRKDVAEAPAVHALASPAWVDESPKALHHSAAGS